MDLGVTHAAVSRRVAAAERWAGVKLFERHGRGVLPTIEGQQLLERLSQAIDALDQVAVRRNPSKETQTVRISTTPSFARFWLIPNLGEIERRAGSVRIDVRAEQRLVDFNRDPTDIVIRYGRGSWKIGAETKLSDEKLVPCASKLLIGTRRVPVKPKDIASLPQLHVGDIVNWRTWCKSHGLAYRSKPSDRFLPDHGLAFDAACAGHGVALANSALINISKLPAALTALSQAPVLGPYGHYLLVRPSASIHAMAIAQAIRVVMNKHCGSVE